MVVVVRAAATAQYRDRTATATATAQGRRVSRFLCTARGAMQQAFWAELRRSLVMYETY